MINLCPHDVVVVCLGKEVVFTASGRVARAVSLTQKELMRTSSGVSVVEPPHYKGVKGLEGVEHTEDIIVSIVVAPLLAKRWKGLVLVPDTGPLSAIRDGEGRVVKVKRLMCYNERD